jgi:hypothetical protein
MGYDDLFHRKSKFPMSAIDGRSDPMYGAYPSCAFRKAGEILDVSKQLVQAGNKLNGILNRNLGWHV